MWDPPSPLPTFHSRPHQLLMLFSRVGVMAQLMYQVRDAFVIGELDQLVEPKVVVVRRRLRDHHFAVAEQRPHPPQLQDAVFILMTVEHHFGHPDALCEFPRSPIGSGHRYNTLYIQATVFDVFQQHISVMCLLSAEEHIDIRFTRWAEGSWDTGWDTFGQLPQRVVPWFHHAGFHLVCGQNTDVVRMVVQHGYGTLADGHRFFPPERIGQLLQLVDDILTRKARLMFRRPVTIHHDKLFLLELLILVLVRSVHNPSLDAGAEQAHEGDHERLVEAQCGHPHLHLLPFAMAEPHSPKQFRHWLILTDIGTGLA
mmetsp:Transcript_111573/g.193637  ORF Transcript_111573/g.193637 Transcript_111573/m.193637 type:complete len:313 (-) Transcript_111573:455-1393(-)